MDLALRQMRHQTKNALQRIIAQIEGSSLRDTRTGSRLADDLQRRIILSARISDALFGFTARPARIASRLEGLAQAVVDLLGDGSQTITIHTEVTGSCCEPLASVLVQVAHEMLGNAVKHGMRLRPIGEIVVSLRTCSRSGIVLEVRDDGWGLTVAPAGQGVSIMTDLADRYRGRISLSRCDRWTVATMTIPPTAGATLLPFASPPSKVRSAARVSLPGRDVPGGHS